MPFSGGYLEQPATTMQILEAIQGEYHLYLKEVNTIPAR